MPGLRAVAFNHCLFHVRRAREWKDERRRRIPLLSGWNVPDAGDLRPRVTAAANVVDLPHAAPLSFWKQLKY